MKCGVVYHGRPLRSFRFCTAFVSFQPRQAARPALLLTLRHASSAVNASRGRNARPGVAQPAHHARRFGYGNQAQSGDNKQRRDSLCEEFIMRSLCCVVVVSLVFAASAAEMESRALTHYVPQDLLESIVRKE